MALEYPGSNTTLDCRSPRHRKCLPKRGDAVCRSALLKSRRGSPARGDVQACRASCKSARNFPNQGRSETKRPLPFQRNKGWGEATPLSDLVNTIQKEQARDDGFSTRRAREVAQICQRARYASTVGGAGR